jgi:hypothetical protein
VRRLKAQSIFLNRANVRLENITAGFAVALHMHQPTIPAGADGALISNLQYMFDHPNEGDDHNSGAFAECYRRMGDIIPEQVAAVGGAADGARGHSGQSQADHL